MKSFEAPFARPEAKEPSISAKLESVAGDLENIAKKLEDPDYVEKYIDENSDALKAAVRVFLLLMPTGMTGLRESKEIDIWRKTWFDLRTAPPDAEWIRMVATEIKKLPLHKGSI